MVAIAVSEVIYIQPQEGVQQEVLSCKADICITGGAAGVGKSWLLRADAIRGFDDPFFNGIIFRRLTKDLKGGRGSMWEECIELYSPFGPRTNETELTFKFPSGAHMKLSHMEHVKNKRDHQGKEYTYIGFDELTHFEEEQFWYLISRLRSLGRFNAWVRATCNPDSTSWVRDLIDWWIGPEGYPIPERSGVLRYFFRDGDNMIWVDADAVDEDGESPTSITFIPGRLEDNKILMDKDPQYRKRLKSLTYVERMQLLYGNWNVSQVNGLFEHHQIDEEGIYRHQVPSGLTWIRYWDLANTEPHPKNTDPDWTAGVFMALHEDAQGFEHIYIKDVKHDRIKGGKKHDWMRQTAIDDGEEVEQVFEQEGGSSGSEVADTYKGVVFKGFRSTADRPTGDKITRANRWVSIAELGNVHLVRDEKNQKPSWFKPFLAELETFPYHKKDQIDGVSGGYSHLKKGKSPGIKKASVGRSRRRITTGF